MIRKTWRRLVPLGVLFVMLTALAANAVRLAIPHLRGSTQDTSQGKPTPYTIIQRETIVDRNGVSHPGSLITRAVRSDGSTLVRLGTAEKGGRDIIFSDGRKVVVYDHRRTKTTVLLSALPPLPDPRSLCMKTLDGNPYTAMKQTILGEEILAGYRTVRISLNGTTIWYALDHGCAAIKSRMEFGSDGASESNLVQLIPGEPDKSLFSVSEDYQEGPPSSAAPPESVRAARNRFEMLDKSYYTHRPR